MRFQSLSLTTPSANVAGAAPATPLDYCFPCNVRYDYSGGGGGGTVIEPVSPPAPTGPTFTVGTLGGEDFASIPTALASPSVVNGCRLLLSAQTFTLTSTLTVNKQITIQGAGQASTTIQSAGTSSDPTNLIVISTSNVTLRDLTVWHRKTSNTSVESAININASTGSSGHFLEAVTVNFMEFGVVIKSDGWQINNCHIAYTGPNNSTRRGLGIYRSAGQGLFTNSTYNSGQNAPVTGNTRLITITTGAGPAEDVLGGYLRIGNVTPSNGFPLAQFLNCDYFAPAATPLTLCVDGCTANETSAFVVFYLPGTQPPLGRCAEITLQGNTLTNVHGKGAIALDGASGTFNPGTTTFYASDNTLTSSSFIGVWATGIDGTADPAALAQLGYNTGVWTDPNQTITPSGGGLSGLITVDGVPLLDGYRVFVVDSGSAITSGIYSANAGAWYRSQDMFTGDDAAGDRFTVTQGTTYAGTNWLCTNSSPAIVGTAALTFAAT